MPDLNQRLDDLRRAVQALPEEADPEVIADLEKQARALLSDAKNTPSEAGAQALFGELARLSNPTSPVAASVRALLRRARIRIDIAGDDDDIDEAIDILAEGLALSPRDPDVIAMLEDAGKHNGQAKQRVNDLFTRYNVERKAPPRPAVETQPEIPKAKDDGKPPQINYPTSAGYPPPEREIYQQQPPTRRTGNMPTYGGDMDDALSEVTQAYYSGDYQMVVDLANRVLSQQPGNATALEYRQKAEDNLIRGVVPDHRIPFDARVAYNRANSLVRAGNYDEAERLYREARDIAERNGILSWKDAEQALLDISDLALAREMINEGDRLMGADNWNDALRKYEGALRVVPNDPQAEERIERVRRIQGDAEGAAAQLSMLGGSLSEQAAQLQTVLCMIGRLRQSLPNSPRLAQLSDNANNRLSAIKNQLHEQAQSALNRANSATALDEKLNLTNDALQLLELGVKLDPGDTALSTLLLEARSAASDMQRARQVIERAANHIAQNYDNELLQARSMLSGLMQYAQDTRYRTVVNDLLTRYIERAVAAVEEGDVEEAQALLQTMRDEPFNVVGRRAEIARLEAQVRSMKQRGRLRLAGMFGGIIFVIVVVALLTRPTWIGLIAPSPTPTPSDTPTPSATFTPSDSPTPSNTPTATDTPTATLTPSRTPTSTYTPTETYTATATLTPSDTPTVTPTPRIICQIFARQNVNARSEPNLNASVISTIPNGTVMDVLGTQNGADGRRWFLIEANNGNVRISGVFVRDDANFLGQFPNNPCPAAP
jgi:tetratricopeptide (TPR) repeat protein